VADNRKEKRHLIGPEFDSRNSPRSYLTVSTELLFSGRVERDGRKERETQRQRRKEKKREREKDNFPQIREREGEKEFNNIYGACCSGSCSCACGSVLQCVAVSVATRWSLTLCVAVCSSV